MRKLRPYQQKAITQCWNSLKKNDDPVLLMASVGAGKSLMLGSILLRMQQANKKALCLVNNAELVRNNCETFREQGGLASIFCAALKIKDISQSIIFATPQTILNAINKNHPIADIQFNMIMIDEAHAINYLNHRSSFMRTLRHYKQQYKDMRVLGATGTNFRFKGASIVGLDCLFRSQVGNITTEQLINENYLVKPEFNIDPKLVLDFSKVKIKSNGQFDQKQLAEVIEKNIRLTQLICQQIIHVMHSQQRFGCFIFATTRKHAEEIMAYLPANESALILGDTKQHERTTILNNARNGKIRYIVNISIISVGVDVPPYDTIAYLRPTESLVLVVQTMGRALRLSHSTQKDSALILDFAGNIQRHSDWDNPLLLDALKQTIDKDKPLVILCPSCNELNTETARRCIGLHDSKRCDYYFEWKDCTGCGTQNDIASRHCRQCAVELIDPNNKLSLEPSSHTLEFFEVINARYGITGTAQSFKIHCAYLCNDSEGQNRTVYETYIPSSEKAKYFFYGRFIKKHLKDPWNWIDHTNHYEKMKIMLNEAMCPARLIVKKDGTGIIIKSRMFPEYIEQPNPELLSRPIQSMLDIHV